jgi:hypothetical protein
VDAYYYFDGAAQLAHGQGFSEPYLWTYLVAPVTLAGQTWRWVGFQYWMPLTSLTAAPALAVAERLAGGALPNDVLFRAAQVPFIGLACLLALLSYGAARLLGLASRHGLAAGLLTVFSPFYFVYWSNTDAFALFGLVTAGGLMAGALAVRQPHRAYVWLLVAGLCAGLAHLSRADGLLVLGCLVVWAAARAPIGSGWASRLAAAGVVAVGYAVVMAPWFWRNLAVVNTPLPAGSIRSLWLTSYDDFFRLPG